MEINRKNYEAYFIDYLEGNLEEKLVDSFIEFIRLNPDLKEELEIYEPVFVAPESVSFEKKNDLYKHRLDTEEEFDRAAVAILEDDITDEEKLEFEEYLAAHPDKEKEARLFNKTKLRADETVIFTQKNKLYKKPMGKAILLWSLRAAAVLIFGLAMFSLIDKEPAPVIPTDQVAKLTDKDKKHLTTPPPKEKPEDIKTKHDPEKKKKAPSKPAVKKSVPKKKESKSIRENAKGRLEQEAVAVIRPQFFLPAKIQTITASIDAEMPEASLATMYLVYPDNSYDDEWLLADQFKETLDLGKISKAGLNLFKSISNDRFTYETDPNGKVTEYSYDSRLLAFSIPGRNSQAE